MPTKRLTWADLRETYQGNKYQGIDPDDNNRKTLTVIDVTLGGDVVMNHYRWGNETWDQERFMAFVDNAKLIRSHVTQERKDR